METVLFESQTTKLTSTCSNQTTADDVTSKLDKQEPLKKFHIDDENIFEHIDEFGKFLETLRSVYSDYPDLLNIRDEMEGNLNRLVYLLRLQ